MTVQNLNIGHVTAYSKRKC